VSFAEALQSKADQNQQSHPYSYAAAVPATVNQQRVQTLGQSVSAPNVDSFPVNNMIRALTVVQQILTEFNNAVTMEAKIQAITKIVLTLMQQNLQ
jgi:hypothetical protein